MNGQFFLKLIYCDYENFKVELSAAFLTSNT